MNPVQIDAVVAHWHEAEPERERLVGLIAAHLPQSTAWPPAERSAWIVDAVDRMHGLLPCPTDLAREAAIATSARPSTHASALIIERDALLAGLAELLGPMDEALRCAWRCACQLFAETVAELSMAPFGARPSTADLSPEAVP
jgi:hypothetical protein